MHEETVDELKLKNGKAPDLEGRLEPSLLNALDFVV